MLDTTKFRRFLGAAAALFLTLLAAAPVAAQGIVLSGVGPINRSMGGAATAAPIDAVGAIHWNPASIGGLPESSVEIGMELLASRHTATSTVNAGAFAPGFPAVDLHGSTDSDVGVSLLPSIGVVYKPFEYMPRWSFGLGVTAIGGFSTNFRGSATNPLFTAPPPAGVGIGGVYGRLGLLQIAPTVAYWVTDTVAIGATPTITTADLQADPAGFAPPDDANGDGFATYPAATHNRPVWGGGFQIGVFHASPTGVNVGFSVKSPQWFDEFEFKGSDELGRPRTITADVTYPLILSLGAAYTGWKGTVLATDVRWIDYQSSKIFGDPAGFGPTGAVAGLDWNSILTVHVGVQRELNSVMKIRLGYAFNENPINDETLFFTVGAPPLFLHVVGIGATLQLAPTVAMNVGYGHAFRNAAEGPWYGAAGPIPGTSIKIAHEADAFVGGLTLFF